MRNATQTFQWFMGEILKDVDFCFAYGQHSCLSLFPQEHDQHLHSPLPNWKPMSPSWTHPSVLSVSLKYPSWDTTQPMVPGSPITYRYTCQHSKFSCHTVIPFGDFPLPTARFLHIHIDLVGPLPSSAGFQYYLTAVDCCIHWPEAFPLPDITALSSLVGLKKDHHDRPRTSVRVTTLLPPGKAMTSTYAGQAPTLPMAKWNAYTAH
jgi:hypothetical protein